MVRPGHFTPYIFRSAHCTEPLTIQGFGWYSCWYYVCSALTTQQQQYYTTSWEKKKKTWTKNLQKSGRVKEIVLLYFQSQSMARSSQLHSMMLLMFIWIPLYYFVFYLWFIGLWDSFSFSILLCSCFFKVICWFIYIFLHSFDTPDACNVNEGWILFRSESLPKQSSLSGGLCTLKTKVQSNNFLLSFPWRCICLSRRRWVWSKCHSKYWKGGYLRKKIHL